MDENRLDSMKSHLNNKDIHDDVVNKKEAAAEKLPCDEQCLPESQEKPPCTGQKTVSKIEIKETPMKEDEIKLETEKPKTEDKNLDSKSKQKEKRGKTSEKSSSGVYPLILLVIVVLVQLYITFFNDPVELTMKTLAEPRILLQGKDPGVPDAAPQVIQETGDLKQTVAVIGPQERPAISPGDRPAVPGVAHGEGSPEPKSPLSVRHRGPIAPGVIEDLKNADITSDSVQMEKYYKAMIYGILILEESRELALSQEQARSIRMVLDMLSEVRGSVPNAYGVILSSLTDEQLKYIYIEMCKIRGNSGPLPPEALDEQSVKLYKLMKERIDKD